VSSDNLEAQLEARRNQLARLEQERADVRIEIDAFQVEYLAQVGRAQADLEALELHLAEYRSRNELLRFRRNALTPDQLEYEVQWRLRGQREQFAGYQESVRRAESTVESRRSESMPIDSAAIKSVYRELAKQIHPDLAADDEDRQARGRLMAQANEAYARHDAQTLEAMLDRAEGWIGPPVPQGDDWLRAEIARLDDIIREARAEIAGLNRSEWMTMKLDAALAQARGVDWFANARRQIEARIARRRVELDGLIAEFRDLVQQAGLA
jgi:hypothetical protein